MCDLNKGRLSTERKQPSAETGIPVCLPIRQRDIDRRQTIRYNSKNWLKYFPDEFQQFLH